MKLRTKFTLRNQLSPSKIQIENSRMIILRLSLKMIRNIWSFDFIENSVLEFFLNTITPSIFDSNLSTRGVYSRDKVIPIAPVCLSSSSDSSKPDFRQRDNLTKRKPDKTSSFAIRLKKLSDIFAKDCFEEPSQDLELDLVNEIEKKKKSTKKRNKKIKLFNKIEILDLIDDMTYINVNTRLKLPLNLKMIPFFHNYLKTKVKSKSVQNRLAYLRGKPSSIHKFKKCLKFSKIRIFVTDDVYKYGRFSVERFEKTLKLSPNKVTCFKPMTLNIGENPHMRYLIWERTSFIIPEAMHRQFTESVILGNQKIKNLEIIESVIHLKNKVSSNSMARFKALVNQKNKINKDFLRIDDQVSPDDIESVKEKFVFKKLKKSYLVSDYGLAIDSFMRYKEVGEIELVFDIFVPTDDPESIGVKINDLELI